MQVPVPLRGLKVDFKPLRGLQIDLSLPPEVQRTRTDMQTSWGAGNVASLIAW